MGRAAVLAGLFLTLGLRGELPAGDKIEPALPPKHRAVAVKIDQSEATGFILPGSRVDVVHAAKAEKDKVKTKVILQDVLVVAVDQPLNKEDPAKLLPATVTLAVPEKDVTGFVLATKNGKISLALRKPDEAKKPKR